MKYNLAIEADHKAASIYFAQLIATNAMVEVKKLSPRRTLNQNAYLHLIIGAFGNHFGYTISESKIIYKQINASIYRYKKKGRVFWKSSADLTKEQMADTIDKFIRVAAENKCELPLTTDTEWLIRIENDLEGNRYLR